MNAALTRQESLFMDRVAHHLAAAGGDVSLGSIEQAAIKVLEDDTRILQALCRNETLRSEAVTHLSALAHGELRSCPRSLDAGKGTR